MRKPTSLVSNPLLQAQEWAKKVPAQKNPVFPVREVPKPKLLSPSQTDELFNPMAQPIKNLRNVSPDSASVLETIANKSQRTKSRFDIRKNPFPEGTMEYAQWERYNREVINSPLQKEWDKNNPIKPIAISTIVGGKSYTPSIEEWRMYNGLAKNSTERYDFIKSIEDKANAYYESLGKTPASENALTRTRIKSEGYPQPVDENAVFFKESGLESVSDSIQWLYENAPSNRAINALDNITGNRITSAKQTVTDAFRGAKEFQRQVEDDKLGGFYNTLESAGPIGSFLADNLRLSELHDAVAEVYDPETGVGRKALGAFAIVATLVPGAAGVKAFKFASKAGMPFGKALVKGMEGAMREGLIGYSAAERGLTLGKIVKNSGLRGAEKRAFANTWRAVAETWAKNNGAHANDFFSKFKSEIDTLPPDAFLAQLGEVDQKIPFAKIPKEWTSPDASPTQKVSFTIADSAKTGTVTLPKLANGVQVKFDSFGGQGFNIEKIDPRYEQGIAWASSKKSISKAHHTRAFMGAKWQFAVQNSIDNVMASHGNFAVKAELQTLADTLFNGREDVLVEFLNKDVLEYFNNKRVLAKQKKGAERYERLLKKEEELNKVGEELSASDQEFKDDFIAPVITPVRSLDEFYEMLDPYFSTFNSRKQFAEKYWQRKRANRPSDAYIEMKRNRPYTYDDVVASMVESSVRDRIQGDISSLLEVKPGGSAIFSPRHPVYNWLIEGKNWGVTKDKRLQSIIPQSMIDAAEYSIYRQKVRKILNEGIKSDDPRFIPTTWDDPKLIIDYMEKANDPKYIPKSTDITQEFKAMSPTELNNRLRGWVTIGNKKLYESMGSTNLIIEVPTPKVISLLKQDGGDAIKGWYDLNTRTIGFITGKSDLSTALHESFHAWTDLLGDDALSTLEKAFGKKGSVDFYEKSARAFERYVRDGEAPTANLEKTFAVIKEEMTRIYQNIKGTPIEAEVNPEIKQLFDEMLGGKKKIESIDDVVRQAEVDTTQIDNLDTAPEPAQVPTSAPMAEAPPVMTEPPGAAQPSLFETTDDVVNQAINDTTQIENLDAPEVISTEPTTVINADDGASNLPKSGGVRIIAKSGVKTEHETFDDIMNAFGESDSGYAGKGVYGAPTNIANIYASKPGRTLKTLEFTFENPLIRTRENFESPDMPYNWITNRVAELETQGLNWTSAKSQASAEYADYIQSKGYDGFIDAAYENNELGEIVAYNKKNVSIKSAEPTSPITPEQPQMPVEAPTSPVEAPTSATPPTTPSEPVEAPDLPWNPMSIANAFTEEIRVALGLNPVGINKTKRIPEEVMAEAEAINPARLIGELRTKSRQLTDVETYALGGHLNRTVDRYATLADRKFAMDSQGIVEAGLDEEVAMLRESLIEMADIFQTSGRLQSQGFNARKFLVDLDNSYAGMMSRVRKNAEEAGKVVSKEDEALIEYGAMEIARIKKEIQDLEKMLPEKKKSENAKMREERRARNVEEKADLINQLKTSLSKGLSGNNGQVSMQIIPIPSNAVETLTIVAKLGMNIAKQGVYTLDDIYAEVSELLKEMGHSIDKQSFIDAMDNWRLERSGSKASAATKDALQARLRLNKEISERSTRGQAEIDAKKLKKEEARIAKKDERAIAQQQRFAERRDKVLADRIAREEKKIKEIEDQLASKTVNPKEPSAPSAPKEVPLQLQELQNKRKQLNDELQKMKAEQKKANATPRPKKAKKTPEEIKQVAVDRLTKDIDVLQEQIDGKFIYESSGAKKTVDDVEILALKKKKNDLVKQRSKLKKEISTTAKTPKTPKSEKTVEETIADLEGQIEDYDNMIKSYDSGAKEGEIWGTQSIPKVEDTPEVKALKEELAKKKRTVAKFKDEMGTFEPVSPIVRDEKEVARLQLKLSDMEQGLAQPRKKRLREESELQPEIDFLQDKVNRKQAELDAVVDSYKDESKLGTFLSGIDSAFRVFRLGGDINALRRQGLAVWQTDKRSYFKGLSDGISSLNKQQASSLNRQLLESTEGKRATSRGLYLSELGRTTEEGLGSKAAGLIPGMKALERFHVSFLNSARLELFKTMTKDANLTIDQEKQLAEFINSMTGRGKLPSGKYEQVLNIFFTAPRMYKGQLDVMLAPFQAKSYKNSAVKKLMVKRIANQLSTIAALKAFGDYTGAYEMSIDPEDKGAFLKIRSGETSIELLGGYTQYYQNLFKTLNRVMTDVEDPQYLDDLITLAKNKMSPAIRAGIGIIEAKDAVGAPMFKDENGRTLLDGPSYAKLFGTIMANDVLEMVRGESHEGESIGKKIGSAALGFTGFGISNYPGNEAPGGYGDTALGRTMGNIAKKVKYPLREAE